MYFVSRRIGSKGIGYHLGGIKLTRKEKQYFKSLDETAGPNYGALLSEFLVQNLGDMLKRS